MRRVVVLSIAALLWLGWGLSGRAQEDESRAVVNKAIKAMGGEKLLASLKAAHLKAKGKAAKVKSVQADRARWPAEVLQVVHFRGLPDAELSNRTSIPSGPGKQTCCPGHGQQATGFLSQSSLAPKAWSSAPTRK